MNAIYRIKKKKQSEKKEILYNFSLTLLTKYSASPFPLHYSIVSTPIYLHNASNASQMTAEYGK